jgi:nucleotide-binding universal stress UspA family protein
LLIMSTRGETGLTRWLLGSVTDHVIRGVSIPIWVIPARDTSE